MRVLHYFVLSSCVIVKIAYSASLYLEKYLVISNILHLKEKINNVTFFSVNINFYILFMIYH